MPKVNKDILVWARVTAGLSEEEAAKKLGLSGPERLKALEEGIRDPSRRQLVNMSKTYRRPLLAFYLPEQPPESDKGQDFRTLPGGGAAGSEALVDALLRDVHARQALVRTALEEAEEDVPLPFVGSAEMKDGIEPLVASIRTALGFNANDFRSQGTVTDAFAALRAATEKAGVLVLLMGNLGSHHTNIDVRFFRGFALADNVAPFVIVNENDSRAAWSFTLVHELAHIWLGQTGISGYDGEAAVERFCDAVAARFLLDPAELEEVGVRKAANFDDLKDRITAFAGDRNLSRKMVAYNLWRSDVISRAVYSTLSDAFDTERVAQKEAHPKAETGPDYYVVRRHRVGPGLIGLVKRMVAIGTLTTTKAGRVLGVKPTAVNRLVDGSRAA
ncbi:MAG: XRE family transcriptional regulator [Hyphomicrobiales bacterium]|nr:XRE family transcriptional regulator [Hyphomicrobiales bacterium]